jgi:hypothetical protein
MCLKTRPWFRTYNPSSFVFLQKNIKENLQCSKEVDFTIFCGSHTKRKHRKRKIMKTKSCWIDLKWTGMIDARVNWYWPIHCRLISTYIFLFFSLLIKITYFFSTHATLYPYLSFCVHIFRVFIKRKKKTRGSFWQFHDHLHSCLLGFCCPSFLLSLLQV